MGNKNVDDTLQGHSRHSAGEDEAEDACNNHVPELDPHEEPSSRVAGHLDASGEVFTAELKPLVRAEAEAPAVSIDHDRPAFEAKDKEESGDVGSSDKDQDQDKDKDKDKDKDTESRFLQDHGWAWLVCFGGFVSHVIIGGFERSDGVLFLEFTDRFKQGAQLTAWPGAICSTTRLFMGPLTTALCNRFSARAATMGGSFIFAVGLIISGFAPNVAFLFFIYGLVQGIGRGLVYAPSLIIVGMYFNRHRGLGVGLATAGVGAGTFVLPPLVEWLFQNFGFQGAFLIMGAVALNSCVVAALYRPLFVHRNIVLGGRIGCRDEEKALRSTARDEETKRKGPEGPEVEIINDAFPTLNTESRNPHENNSKKMKPSIEAQKWKLSGSLQKSRTSHALKTAFSICFPTEVQKKDAPKRKLIEWSLLKNPAFLFYCFNICLFTAAFKSAFTFLPALAKSQGMSPTEAAYLLSISGILDTFGRIMAGFILDIRCIRPFRPVLFNSVVFVITGLSFVSPYLKTFGGFAVLFGLYGMLTGTYASQKSVILVDILGQEKLSSSLGLMICFQGIGTCIGPPVSGLLKDVFGRYDEAFFLGGAAMAMAGLLMVVSNIYMTLQRRRHARAESS